MARTAQSIMENALLALETWDAKKAGEVLAMDAAIDELEIRIDNECMRVLALTGPYGVDFRYVFSVIRTTRDLERIGDESKTVAKWTRKLAGRPPAEVVALGRRAHDALDAAVKALVQNDVAAAEKTLEIEYSVDEIEDKIMQGDPPLALAFIAKAFERIADLATNVAENVIFSVKAEDIRHGGFKKA